MHRHSHLDNVIENYGGVSDEQGERFHQEEVGIDNKGKISRTLG